MHRLTGSVDEPTHRDRKRRSDEDVYDGDSAVPANTLQRLPAYRNAVCDPLHFCGKGVIHRGGDETGREHLQQIKVKHHWWSLLLL